MLHWRWDFSNVPAGITVNEITNTNGAITVWVAASCSAALGANTLQLRATGGATTALGNFIVNVTANTPPALGTYPAAGPLSLGGGVTITPDAPPMDNGAVTNITAAAPGFSGNFSVNPNSGAVTISSAGPVGNHTVTVTATDNCSATTTRTFALAILQAEADLVISKTASANRVLAASNVNYNITVTNNGPATASAITVTDLLPANTTFVSCAATGGGVCGSMGASQIITIASLPAAASATITLVASVNPTVTSWDSTSRTVRTPQPSLTVGLLTQLLPSGALAMKQTTRRHQPTRPRSFRRCLSWLLALTLIAQTAALPTARAAHRKTTAPAASHKATPAPTPPATQSNVDLTVTALSAASVVTDSQTLLTSGELVATIKNLGSAATAAQFRVLAFEDRNANGQFNAGTDALLGSTNVTDSIAAGVSANLSLALSGTVTFKGNLIYVFVDSENAIVETNENNNIRNTGGSNNPRSCFTIDAACYLNAGRRA